MKREKVTMLQNLPAFVKVAPEEQLSDGTMHHQDACLSTEVACGSDSTSRGTVTDKWKPVQCQKAACVGIQKGGQMEHHDASSGSLLHQDRCHGREA